MRIFGKPMSFWSEQVPAGTLLQDAAPLSDPLGRCTLASFLRRVGARLRDPLPVEQFVEYGRWFQRCQVPDIDRRRVKQVRTGPDGFILTTWDDGRFRASRVVVAAGVADFAWRPPEYAGLPAALVSHTVDHADLSALAGRQVVVVGSGQSAVEAAALLHEVGAEVQLAMRSRSIRWLGPDHGVAPWPAAVHWLRRRVEPVPVLTGARLIEATARGNRASLRFDNGMRCGTDHVLLGTGYRIDVGRYDFLAPELLAGVARSRGRPCLSGGFESSVAGLHFAGAVADDRSGTQCLAGVRFASQALAQAMTGSPRRLRA